MEKQFFGTDGVRGYVGKGNITPENILKLGWAAGMAFKQEGISSVLMGKDTRLSGYMLEGALLSGFCSAGVHVKLLGPMPTPGISYLTQAFRAQAGVVISASHNPFHDNGVKFFNAHGKKIDDEIEARITELLDEPMEVVEAEKIGRVKRIDGAAERYIEFCKSKFPARFSLHGLKVALDCANGATYHIAPEVFKELGAQVITVGNEPNGTNINRDVGSTHMGLLQQTVLENKADIGIAFDGDGDRVLMVDHLGNIVDGDQLIFILARDAMKNGRLEGGVVGTLMTNSAMELALTKLGIPMVRANVGDRYVLAEMETRGWHLGGEGSGHILNLNTAVTGDAIVAALQLLTAMTRCDMSLHALSQGYTPSVQVMNNVRVENKDELLNRNAFKTAIADEEEKLHEGERILIRPSGTEPVVRIMAESQDQERAQSIVDRLTCIGETR